MTYVDPEKLQARHDDANEAQGLLARALQRMLVPIVRLLLQHGMPFQAFARISKRVYVQVAREDFRLPHKPASKSRIALLTGLTRPDVTQIMKEEEHEPTPERWNRASSVLEGWVADKEYRVRKGVARVLGTRGVGSEFEKLVRKYGGDVPKGAMLDELIRAGCVELDADGNAHMISRYFIPEFGSSEMLDFLGSAGNHLLSTLEHNIMCEDEDERRLQNECWSAVIPREKIGEVRRTLRTLLTRQAKQSMDKLEAVESKRRAPGSISVGVGYYYYEE